MNQVWNQFLDFLKQENDTEYGDFKREVDAHLRHAVEQGGPLTPAQQQKLVELRGMYLWQDHENDEIDWLRAQLASEFEDFAQRPAPGAPKNDAVV